MTTGLADSNLMAYSQMAASVRAQCAAAAGFNGGVAVPLEYGGVLYQIPQGAKSVFARFIVQGAAPKKRTLSTPSRVTKPGIITIQLIVTKATPNANSVGRNIADILENAVKGRVNDVIFLNCFVKDGGGDERYFTWLISATYNYDVLE